MVDLSWVFECSELTLYAEYLLHKACSRNESCVPFPFLGCKQGTFHAQKIDGVPVGHFSVWIGSIHRGALSILSRKGSDSQVAENAHWDHWQYELFGLLSPVSNFCRVGFTSR